MTYTIGELFTMARGQKTNLRPVKLHLSMPKELADWVEEEMLKSSPRRYYVPVSG